jgi:protein phosphatase 2C family protein 2/3
MSIPDGKDPYYWPKCSFFAIYDGHGGSLCADFLKDHLHQIIIN